MVVSIPEFGVESPAVSRGSVTRAAPDERERTPESAALVGPGGRIGESENVDGGRANGVVAR